jgi:hypothetical protein
LTQNLTTILRANKNGMPLTISSTLFTMSTEYQIYLTLVNFLGMPSSSFKSIIKIDSNIPVVSIVGSSTMNVMPKDQLSVRAAIKSASISSLSVSWKIYLNEVEQLRLTSIAKDRSLYKLDSYSLKSGYQYVVELTVSNSTSLFESTNSVTVNVLRSDLIALIDGPNKRSCYIGEPLTLDASNSHDPDYALTDPRAFELKFSWNCMLILPQTGIFSGDCTTNLPILTFQTDSWADGLVIQITVEVNDPSTKRFSSTIAIIEMTKASDVVFSIQKSPTGKVNVNNELSLSVLAGVQSGCNMIWSTDYLNADKLQLLSSTPTNMSIGFTGQIEKSTFQVPLILVPDTLVEGSNYNFKLACYRYKKEISSISITVVVNDSPAPGQFNVQPIRGVALIDTFTFSNNDWVDVDLPLTYTFYYLKSLMVHLAK